MRPRKDRWLSLLEVAALLAKERPELLQMSRKRRREHVLRLVRRCERRDGDPISKQVGREWFVSRNSVDALRRWEPEALSEIQRDVADLRANYRQQQRQMNSHGSRLRNVEREQRLAMQFLEGLAQLKSRTSAA